MKTVTLVELDNALLTPESERTAAQTQLCSVVLLAKLFWQIFREDGCENHEAEVLGFLLSRDWSEFDPTKRSGAACQPLVGLIAENTVLGGARFYEQRVVPWARKNLKGSRLRNAEELTQRIAAIPNNN